MAATRPPAICPHCKRGVRIEETTAAGDFSYCGYCGKNWAPPLRVVEHPKRAKPSGGS